MSDALTQAQALEALLARIYVDAGERARFLADPRGYALAAGLSSEQAAALLAVDRSGLALTANTFAHKREATARARAHVDAQAGVLRRVLARLWPHRDPG